MLSGAFGERMPSSLGVVVFHKRYFYLDRGDELLQVWEPPQQHLAPEQHMYRVVLHTS